MEDARVTRSIAPLPSDCRKLPQTLPVFHLPSSLLISCPRMGVGHRCLHSHSVQMPVPWPIPPVLRILTSKVGRVERTQLYLSLGSTDWRTRRCQEVGRNCPPPSKPILASLQELCRDGGLEIRGSTHAVSKPQARWWRRRCSAQDEKLQRSGQGLSCRSSCSTSAGEATYTVRRVPKLPDHIGP